MELSTFFERRLQKLVAQLEKRLDQYVKNPQEERRIHDIRTSLRRLDSVYPLLNKKSRKANRKRMAEYQDFFKTNSRMRDYDIIMMRLTSLSPESGPLVAALQKRKGREMEAIVRKAKVLRKVGKITVQKITNEEIEARLDKVLAKISIRIKANLSPTLLDSRNVEQLHALRKDLKKVRYILQSLDTRSTRKYKTKMSADVGLPLDVALIQKMQDKLGDLHDSDITLEYLKSSRAKVAVELYSLESKARESRYNDFVVFMNSIRAVNRDVVNTV
jgi:CHAD domain-containing protein